MRLNVPLDFWNSMFAQNPEIQRNIQPNPLNPLAGVMRLNVPLDFWILCEHTIPDEIPLAESCPSQAPVAPSHSNPLLRQQPESGRNRAGRRGSDSYRPPGTPPSASGHPIGPQIPASFHRH